MWYKVEDKLPELKQVDIEYFESELVLVKINYGIVCVAYLEMYEGYALEWRTDCSSNRDITKEVTEWTEIPK